MALHCRRIVINGAENGITNLVEKIRCLVSNITRYLLKKHRDSRSSFDYNQRHITLSQKHNLFVPQTEDIFIN
ncbi:hypothetical protein UPYG_G00169380 [Umbra pygmaea]|uniref:Uncharacterized protein n=1 Tax=Umbra pygmaea TaxID=75934 RepID=A0ABD0WNC7_UMBPY